MMRHLKCNVDSHDAWVTTHRHHSSYLPCASYGDITPEPMEIGMVSGVRFILSSEGSTEFVTTEEFTVLMRNPLFKRDTAIQGRIFNTTFISLVPPT